MNLSKKIFPNGFQKGNPYRPQLFFLNRWKYNPTYFPRTFPFFGFSIFQSNDNNFEITINLFGFDFGIWFFRESGYWTDSNGKRLYPD